MSKKIIHLITSLQIGGAEMALYNYLSSLPPEERALHAVISLTEGGAVADKITALGISVHALAMPAGRPTLSGIKQLFALLKRYPQWRLVCWMYHAMALGLLTALLHGAPRRHIWYIHNGAADISGEKPLTQKLIRGLAWLSFMPDKILYISDICQKQHQALGYKSARAVIMPNGYDCSRFMPDDTAPARLRAALNIPATTPMIGHIARWDWAKDHANFLAALAQIPSAVAVLVGKGMDKENKELAALITKNGVAARVYLLGYRADVPALLPAFDITCLSSRTEAMPNVVVESMACGVPCVVTDVGNAAELVGGLAPVVPRQNAQALAAGLQSMLNLSPEARQQRGLQARAHVLTHYTLEHLRERFSALLSAINWQ